MKQFNQIITVEVQVDSIAQMLLETMSPDYKHRELVTEAVIGTGLEKNTLTYIYNALNGHVPHLNFNVGDTVICTGTYWGDGRSSEIGICKIVEINPYSETPLKVEYEKFYEDGAKSSKHQQWVRSSKCERIPIEESVSL